MKFEVVEARRTHCMQMARTLRYAHQAFLLGKKIDIRRELIRLYDASFYRKAWLADGELMGLGGVRGDIMSTTGSIWLTVTEKAMQHPIAMVREARRQLAMLMLLKQEIDTTISFEDAAAQNFAIYLGFFCQGEFRWRKDTSSRRRLYLDRINRTPPKVVHCGNHFQIGMVYTGECA